MGRKSLVAVRRLEILEHFYHLIIEEGLEGASTVKLSRRMGIRSSLLMHYFPTKEDMIQALIVWLMELYENRFLPMLEEKQSPEARFETVIDALFSPAWENLADGRVFYSCYTLIFRDEGVRARFQQTFARFHEHLCHEITRAADAGLIKVSDPSQSAHILISWVEGFNFYQRILADQESFEAQGKIFRRLVENLFREGVH
ncbi:MAG: TetR/AcrR family transcriptional regulator [Bacteroidetes bacterium]|nr:MAG: TetR/AcrR family transcriptional regulator [Bacteroidota bacterium]